MAAETVQTFETILERLFKEMASKYGGRRAIETIIDGRNHAEYSIILLEEYPGTRLGDSRFDSYIAVVLSGNTQGARCQMDVLHCQLPYFAGTMSNEVAMPPRAFSLSLSVGLWEGNDCTRELKLDSGTEHRHVLDLMPCETDRVDVATFCFELVQRARELAAPYPRFYKRKVEAA